MNLELKDKVILITGGAKGISAAAAEGAIPVVVDKNVEAGNELHSHLPASEFVIAELSSPESRYAAVDHTIRRLNRLDAVVNNAGVNDKIGLEQKVALERCAILLQAAQVT